MRKHKKRTIIITAVLIVIVSFFIVLKVNKDSSSLISYVVQKIANSILEIAPVKKVEVPKIAVNSDKDNDGVLDLDDIVQGARKEAVSKTKYKDSYYSGGYPPDNEGVCTDVVWRALKNAGYDFKTMIDEDIKKNAKDYPAVNGKPDPNIDFRRVKNLYVFFSKYADSLTLELKPYDVDNLKEWQGGDIVIFKKPIEHVAIISDKRRPDGVPYVIHNSSTYAKEQDCLQLMMPNIIGHFRFPKTDIEAQKLSYTPKQVIENYFRCMNKKNKSDIRKDEKSPWLIDEIGEG